MRGGPGKNIRLRGGAIICYRDYLPNPTSPPYPIKNERSLILLASSALDFLMASRSCFRLVTSPLTSFIKSLSTGCPMHNIKPTTEINKYVRYTYQFRLFTASVFTHENEYASVARGGGSGISEQITAQAAQALYMNHTNNTIWHQIIRVYMGFSTRYPWRQLKVKILNKNNLPYSIPVLFAPGVVILPI